MDGLTASYDSEDIKVLTLSLASPEEILARSHGRVSNPNTFDPETSRPIKGGLLCPKIFGLRPGEMCLCDGGKPSNEEFCSNCGVNFVSQLIAQSRFGHIDLAVPVVHTWFYKTTCSLLTLVTGLKATDIRDIVLCDKHLIKTSVDNYRKGKLVSTAVFMDLCKHGKGNNVLSGGRAILDLVTAVEAERIKGNLAKRLRKVTSFERSEKLREDLSMIEGIASGSIKLERLVISVLPVLPSALRPKVYIKPNLYVDSALTNLYVRVVSANNSVLESINSNKGGTTDTSFIKKIRALQNAIDALIDSAEDDDESTESTSLTGLLNGKSGHFRRLLLGRRVDYSGRTVIAPGPELKLDECSVPVAMAEELFGPLVSAKLKRITNSRDRKCVKQIARKGSPLYVNMLRKVSHNYPVILNRAPTLHKLGMLAFKMKLTNEKVIRLHPLVCFGFNADFDGDQMAIHIPLSKEARREAKTLLIATRNVLHPANGTCAILPTKDMVLGIYYVSLVSKEDRCDKVFMCSEEASAAMTNGMIKLHTAIYVYDQSKRNVLQTTPGRLLITKLLPAECAFAYSTEMPCMDKEQIGKLINRVYESCGRKQMVELCESLMKLGLKFVSISGLSIGSSFLKKIDERKQLLWKIAKESTSRNTEMREVCDVWRKCIYEANAFCKDAFNVWNGELASEQIIVKSGAAASAAQMEQLMIAKADAYSFSGRQCRMPIISSYYEGLSPMQMFYSTYSTRRGLIDTALKTATAGYFARKLVEVARECIVTEVDCGTSDCITYEMNGDVNETRKLIKGRFSAQSVTLRDGNVIPTGKMITETEINLLNKLRGKIMIRSPITCLSECGVCSKCYGINLGTGTTAEIGDSVGTIAAQAISEPGTQMTLRTFHGLTKRPEGEINKTEKLTSAPTEGEVKLEGAPCAQSRLNEIETTTAGCTIEVLRNRKAVCQQNVRLSDRLLARDGRPVKQERLFAPARRSLEFALERTQNVRRRKGNGKSCSKSDETNVALNEQSWLDDGEDRSVQSGGEVQLMSPPEEIICVNETENEDVSSAEQSQGLTCLSELFDGKPNEIISNLVEFGCTKGQFAPINADDFECPSLKVIGLLESDVEVESLLSRKFTSEDLFDLNTFVNLFVQRVLSVYSSYGINLHAQHVEIILKQMLGFVIFDNLNGVEFTENKWEVVRKLNHERAKRGEQTFIGARRLINVTGACERYGSKLANISFGRTAERLAKTALTGRPILLDGVKDAIIVGKTPNIGKMFRRQSVF
ncbi:MAG: hypothetical protein ACTS7D_00470 [Candidatus Hodgkinia cicadicola]